METRDPSMTEEQFRKSIDVRISMLNSCAKMP